jgi:hypothetical protein
MWKEAIRKESQAWAPAYAPFNFGFIFFSGSIVVATIFFLLMAYTLNFKCKPPSYPYSWEDLISTFISKLKFFEPYLNIIYLNIIWPNFIILKSKNNDITSKIKFFDI